MAKSVSEIARHVVQILVFLAINGKLLGIAGTRIVVPVLYPSQAPYAAVAGAWESLEFTIARGVFPLLVVGVILLTGITVGRLFCGWACPMGLVQDLLSYVPLKKDANWMNLPKNMKHLKWAIVLLSLALSALIGWRRNLEGEAQDTMVAPFELFSPSGTLFAYIPWMALWKSNVLFGAHMGWAKLILLLLTLVPSVFIPRFFCKYLCPLGASLEPFAPFKFLRINRNSGFSREENNKVLDAVCSMGVKIGSESDQFIADPNCIHCGACVAQAPEMFQQAIDL